MARRVAIVGTAQLPCTAQYDGTVREMVFKVAHEVLSKAGLTRNELGTVVTSSSDYWGGIACSNEYYLDAAGGYLKDTSKVEEDSLLAFMYALMRVMSGHFDTALVVAVTKGSEIPTVETLSNLYGDPFYQRPAALEDLSAAALQVQSYLHKYGLDGYAAAEVAAKNLNNANLNPNALHKGKVTIQDVLASDILAYPIRALEKGALCDGACAVLLAADEAADRLAPQPAWIKGVGWSVANYYLGDRNLVNGTLQVAARQAYQQAGINNPLEELDLAEICESYSYQELMFTEGLGFCEPGKGSELLKKGVTAPGGQLPVNPSGGVLGANPYVARGLYRLAEAANQVMGLAGPHQMDGVKTALAHSCHGFAGQSQAVAILGR